MSQDKKKSFSYKKFRIRRSHVLALCLAFFDAFSATIAYFLALVFRHDFIYGNIPEVQKAAFIRFFGIYCAIVVVVYLLFKLYNSIWKYASYTELFRIIFACFVTNIAHWLLLEFAFKGNMPITYYLGGGFIQFVFTVASRFS